MKTLFDLCKPRENVFDENKREDVIDLTNLAEESIDPHEFFQENYLTDGMKLLFETAFKRFNGKGSTGLIKLTQSMGGGKTHNMVALGLLSKYPELREKVMGEDFNKGSNVNKVRVVAFTGRESDAPFGIWGSIAEQLGKREFLKDYYSPLKAPGQNAWINLLKGEPLLILLDELPPYLVNAESIVVGDSNLAKVTTTALSNLFTAIAKNELSNVCLVISDLRATYESGSEMIQRAFKELEGEVSRYSLNLEPVASTSDEIYHILRKRLFIELPDEDKINEVANSYKEALKEAKQMSYTGDHPDELFLGIKSSYPFHPSMKHLYARFKENEGFQQTRGLIRLMRLVVKQLYSGQIKSKQNHLINVHDFDLNDNEMLTTITSIKPALTNAISHDISHHGHSVAELIDAGTDTTMMQDLSKLVLVASLADVPNALLGLTEPEIIGILCSPNRDIVKTKEFLNEYMMRAWYLHTDDRDGRLHFRNTENMIAQMNSLVKSYDNDIAKKELKELLEEKFKPSMGGDCYQKVMIFPAVDELNMTQDKVNLVLFEPSREYDLHPDLKFFYEDTRYKNRIMFLTGQTNTQEKLWERAKELKAIKAIIQRMKDDRITESNPHYKKALDKLDKILLSVLSAARESFVTLHYPSKNGLSKTEIRMEFGSNSYNGESQIRDVLERERKFTKDVDSNTFLKKCEIRLFTQKEMRWNDIKDRAATNPEWQWHTPRALDDLKDKMIQTGVWRENGGYVEKGPFYDETEVQVQNISWDKDTGEAKLKLIPKYGDQIYYEVDGIATEASKLVENLNEFKTKELKLSFICVDSSGAHPTGEPYFWTNQVKIQTNTFDKEGHKYVELKAHPGVILRYTTDGSNPKDNGAIYSGEFIVPDDSTHVLVVAENDECIYDEITLKIDRSKNGKIQIDKVRPLYLEKDKRTNDTKETYEEIEMLKKHNASISDVVFTLTLKDERNNDKGWIETSIDPNMVVDMNILKRGIEALKDSFKGEQKVDIGLEYANIKFATGQNFEDWVADNKIDMKDIKESEIRQ